MSLTSLSQNFGAHAVTGEYAGAETVLNFGSPAAELDALRHRCGIFDLGWRGKLVVSGEDRVRWLNGMVSNNTRDLRQDFGNYSFVLNAQGRVQADLLVFQRGEFYVLESEAAQIAAIREFFERFIIMDDVEISDISGRLISIGLAGPRALELLNHAVLSGAGLNPAAPRTGQLLDGSWNGIGFSLVRDPIELRNWYEIWLAPENVETFWSALVAAGAEPVGAEALEWQRILLGLPRVGLDTGVRELPQEIGQQYALNHAKGCYIGQEIVERINSQGQVRRRFVGLIVEGRAPARGSRVMAGEKEIGEITSSAELVLDGKPRTLALGYVKCDAVARCESRNESMCVGGDSVRIAALPFQF
jgi:folate-binding protein YgfZ